MLLTNQTTYAQFPGDIIDIIANLELFYINLAYVTHTSDFIYFGGFATFYKKVPIIPSGINTATDLLTIENVKYRKLKNRKFKAIHFTQDLQKTAFKLIDLAKYGA